MNSGIYFKFSQIKRLLNSILFFLFFVILGIPFIYSQPCTIAFHNGIGCPIQVKLYFDCAGLRPAPMHGYPVTGTWDIPTVTEFMIADPLYCGAVCLYPDMINCIRVELDGQIFIPMRAPDNPNINPPLFCCNASPNLCIQDNCGQLTIDCDIKKNKIILRLLKPRICH